MYGDILWPSALPCRPRLRDCARIWGRLLMCVGLSWILWAERLPVTRRRYRLDLTNIDQDFANSLPFLKQEEAGRLYILRNVFDSKGQSEVVQAIDAFLALRFRDAHVIAHLLHSNILGLEDYGLLCGGMITRADSVFSTASAFERACFNQRYPSPVTNAPVQPMTLPGAHIPGPLFCMPLTPAWLTNTSRGQASRPTSLAERMLRRGGSSGRNTPFQVYDEFGCYLPRPAVRSPIPVPFASRRWD